jgi:EAL domain-containing protein (putative c-di-GMP-specific phosphodiesterase class I)
MGLITVAESVESPGLIDMLREIGVDHAQGHGIDTPKPLHQVLQLPEQEWNSVRTHASGTAG